MKKHRPELVGRAPSTAASAAQVLIGQIPAAKTRGSLNRTVLAMLGKGLRDCFDEVRKQEVPERFKLLLGTGDGNQ
jgi:hypothetical protein